jgi:two-component system, OmpR family, phosphate regulon sensor histidine kinase PhoR
MNSLSNLFQRSPARDTSWSGLLERLLEAVHDGAFVADPSLRVAAANRSAALAFSRLPGGLVGRRITEIIRDLQLHEALSAAVERGQGSELRVELINGTRRSYNVCVSPLELDTGTHAVCIFYDVSEMERLEKVRQEFLSNISHELRTPLTSILAFVETLEDGAIDDAQNNRRFLGVIRRNAERMHELIADILELSMIESGNVAIETRPVRPAAMIDEIMASLASKAAEGKVDLINEVAPATELRADPVRLGQMLTNLIDNAIKFNRPGGTVTVSADCDAARAVIAVADTGEGILPAHLPRVFERLYRADRGRTREVGGTGLGLAIVKHLALLHGGTVNVDSTPGVGTTFTIELPA